MITVYLESTWITYLRFLAFVVPYVSSPGYFIACYRLSLTVFKAINITFRPKLALIHFYIFIVKVPFICLAVFCHLWAYHWDRWCFLLYLLLFQILSSKLCFSFNDIISLAWFFKACITELFPRLFLVPDTSATDISLFFIKNDFWQVYTTFLSHEMSFLAGFFFCRWFLLRFLSPHHHFCLNYSSNYQHCLWSFVTALFTW